MSEHVHDENCDHDNEEGDELSEALELDTETQLFLEMRDQNIELLKLAIEMAGFSGQHPALKPHDVKNALKTVGDLFYEFYGLVDPQQTEEDEYDEEEDDE